MGRARIVVSDFVAQIGARVRVLRFERGLSMGELAEMAGCSPHSLMQIELGRAAMTLGTIHKLALALRVEPFDILNHDTQTDDVGSLLETMRHHPQLVRCLRAKLDSRPSRAARPRS